MGGKLQEIWDILIGEKKPEAKKKKDPFASYDGSYINSWSFDGEKNLGEAGPIKNYSLDFVGLRMRSWQSYLESDIAQTVIKKYCKWTIGSGLKLQSEPNKVVLKSEGISLSTEVFNEIVEARFSIFAKSKSSDYSGMENIHMLAYTTKLHAIVGGDVLVIQRYVDGQLKIQLIDGAHVCSPMGTDFLNNKDTDGNITKNGIVQNSRGEHIAYWVKKDFNSYEKIEAKSESTGLQKAFLVYGLKYRLDNNRGMPLLSVVLETLKKLERYKEAVVGSAEERQKIPYTIEHQLGSTGENPLARQLAKAFDADATTDDIPYDELGKALANTVAATTNKQVFNMPINSALKALESKNELYFKDFYSVNADIICAAVDIPPNVAFSKFDTSYSSSRAAIKEWEHTINVDRVNFSFQFYQNIYNFWLEIEIYKNKIQAPGYLLAKAQGNQMVLDAYRNARFVGANVPHIDPLKEVQAVRAKLGPAGANIPLTTVEAGTEELNGGDSDQNMLQFALELKESQKLGIVLEEKEEKPVNSED